ncbi:hypothetical protein E2C01_064997 [Portunus trituberculatus]|uniref:Uncharacterized protein n=1 Tax=Portunus trituberculatus TaxID=210409 RepID=A0A5B7HDB3_PORTR|nr:hypothetical protein [Portunus trituberculatus]
MIAQFSPGGGGGKDGRRGGTSERGRHTTTRTSKGKSVGSNGVFIGVSDTNISFASESKGKTHRFTGCNTCPSWTPVAS